MAVNLPSGTAMAIAPDSPMVDTEKAQVQREEAIHDHDVMGGKEIDHEAAMHFGELTEEELVHQKKLLRIIDSLIMPIVMVVSQRKHAPSTPSFWLTSRRQVYLMNYIDRNSSSTWSAALNANITDLSRQTTLQLACKAWRMT